MSEISVVLSDLFVLHPPCSSNSTKYEPDKTGRASVEVVHVVSHVSVERHELEEALTDIQVVRSIA